jgi:hypothetical protein
VSLNQFFFVDIFNRLSLRIRTTVKYNTVRFVVILLFVSLVRCSRLRMSYAWRFQFLCKRWVTFSVSKTLGIYHCTADSYIHFRYAITLILDAKQRTVVVILVRKRTFSFIEICRHVFEDSPEINLRDVAL